MKKYNKAFLKYFFHIFNMYTQQKILQRITQLTSGLGPIIVEGGKALLLSGKDVS